MVDIEVLPERQGWNALAFGKSLEETEVNSRESSTENEPPRKKSKMDAVEINIPRISDREGYALNPAESRVELVVREVDGSGEISYVVNFEDGHTETLPFQTLINLENGNEALSAFENGGTGVNGTEESESVLQLSSAEEQDDEEEQGGSSDDVLTTAPTRVSSRTRGKGVKRKPPPSGSSSSSDVPVKRSNRRALRSRDPAILRRSSRKAEEEPQYIGLVDEDEGTSDSVEELELLESDILPKKRRTRRLAPQRGRPKAQEINGLKFDTRRQRESTRQSGRTTRHQKNMREADMDDIYRSDSDAARPAPKAVGAREAFQPLPSSHPFHLRHCQQCDTCGRSGGPHGQLVYCQGCSLSYHKGCLGTRTTREHLVTKVGEAEFVLQCRRCISFARRKEPTAPDQGMCQNCRESGPACHPFRGRKTAAQEEREREENDGQDPVIGVDKPLINNSHNVLFRCMNCWRAFHFHHLKPKSDTIELDGDEERIANARLLEYGRDWMCLDCSTMPAKISGLVAWRPVDPDVYEPGATVDEVNEDVKEYLIKWEAKSYFQCQWMHGAWVWGVTNSAMRRAFVKRKDGKNVATLNTEDAIPEEYLQIDIILTVQFTSIVDTRAEEVDKARIKEVDKALIKFKGLGYEDAVWEKVPDPPQNKDQWSDQDKERWTNFVTAYNDWVMGRYVRCPKAPALKARLEKVRSTDFTSLEKKKQPDKLVGGELMNYQLEGLNWLYYRWYISQNAILADEMGLGKTIQVIGYLTTMVQDHNCFPFLIVVPNSTCPNWRREIKRWAPSLRVVAYYGSAAARSLSYQYELFPEGSKEVRCHVVVTSYEAAADENCRRFFKSVPWQGLIVDEGQRLKSDKNLLYTALSALKIPFRVLLTGTPLQNNARELFNLLQFLDDSFDAAALELEYSELTKENIPQLHNLIRPFFLRRTKGQVLTFLPPMAQIIVPLSMTPVQTKLYQSILTKNPELVRAILSKTGRSLAKGERMNLNNILMQLRKCLTHPFVYSREIEERDVELAASHRNLVEASSKLQLLELLLPKLRDRGHRVLIFSQFLDMLDIIEDFLDGLALQYQRLDGTITSLEKQKRIDKFNAKDSPYFAFLLSTRAGGIGINLASADTVIILDPDFNPHQDIQALSRAHRIGQKNKVLVFQLMTRQSAEEKIVQVGRKKMALDHVLIEQMDADEDSNVDMEGVLRFGAADILEGKQQEITYDDASVEKLLDRSQIEDTKAGEDNTAESQFSFARVWANDAASMMDSLGSSDEEDRAPDPSAWDKILKERELAAAEEAAARQQALGRGKRARHMVDYSTKADADANEQPEKEGDSDTDFLADKRSDGDDDDDADDSGEDKAEEEGLAKEELKDLRRTTEKPVPSTSKVKEPQVTEPKVKSFQRAKIRWPTATSPVSPRAPADDPKKPKLQFCVVCGVRHEIGFCPLKLAGPEYCNLCGLAHYGVARSCPHIRSETQVRAMLGALKQSPESKELVENAKKYLTGVKGTLVQDKKRKAEKIASNIPLRNVQDQGSTENVAQNTVSQWPPPSIHRNPNYQFGLLYPDTTQGQQFQGQSSFPSNTSYIHHEQATASQPRMFSTVQSSTLPPPIDSTPPNTFRQGARQYHRQHQPKNGWKFANHAKESGA